MDRLEDTNMVMCSLLRLIRWEQSQSEVLPGGKLVSCGKLPMFVLILVRASSRVSPSTFISAVPSKGHKNSCRTDKNDFLQKHLFRVNISLASSTKNVS